MNTVRYVPVRMIWLALVAGAFTGFSQSARIRSVPLQIESTRSVSAGNGKLTIFKNYPVQQAGDLHVSFEAEDYTDIFWQGVSQETTNSEDLLREMQQRESLKWYDDPSASGGRYIERVSSVTYYFGLEEPGDYTIWYRFYKPREASWSFKQHLSRTKPAEIKLAGPVGEWFWQKGETYTLDKRTFRLQLADFFNGKRLDKIILSRDPKFVPEDAGLASTSPAGDVREGVVEFVPVEITVGSTDPVLQITRTGEGGTVKTLYSSDAGKTWKELSDDGRFRLPHGETCRVSVLVMLQADKQGKYPEIKVPELIEEVSQEQFAALTGDRAEYLFDRRSGVLDSIRLAGAVPVWIKSPSPGGSLFRMTVKPDNSSSQGAVQLEAADFEWLGCDAQESSVSFKFRNLQYGLNVTVSNSLTAAGFLDMSFLVENSGADDVLEVVYPVINQVRVGASALDDTLLWPFGTGKKYTAPVSQSALTAYYPRAGVGFLSLYDESAGFYMGNHDPELYSTVMNASADESRTWMNFSFVRRNRIRAGGGSVSYRFAMGAHPGSWHQGALWYKAWYQTVFPEFQPPDWVAESNGWLFDNLSQNKVRYGQLSETVFRRAMILGLSHVQLWGSDGAASCPTYYYPPEFIGGPEELKGASEWWRQRGGQIGYYLLPQGPSAWCFSDESKAYFGVPWEELPDWAVPPGKKSGQAWAWLEKNARYERPDRKLENNYGASRTPHKNPAETDRSYPWDYMPMSSYSKEWNDWFTFWVADKYVRDWKCSTVYLDTFHTQADNPDYNPHLGLHGDGQGGQLRSGLARQISETGKKYDPDFLPIMEMQCDAYTPWMAIQCSSSAHDTEMYKFTHPECVFFEGHTAQGTRSNEIKFKRYGSCWLYGNLFDHRIIDGWAMEAVNMRRWVTRWLNAARFLDDLGLQINSSDVKGKVHRILEGGTRGFLVTFWTPGRQEWPAENDTLTGREWKPSAVRLDLAPLAEIDATGTVPADWIPRKAVLVSLGEEPRALDFRVKGNTIEFDLPPRQMNGVLFVCEAEGPFTFLAQCVQKDFQQMDLTLINLAGSELRGSVSLESPDFPGISGATSFQIPENKQDVMSFSYPDKRPPDVARRVKVSIDAGNDIFRTLDAAAYPFMDDASFEQDQWRVYDTSSAADGVRSLAVTAGKPEKFLLYPEPETRYRLTFKARSQSGQNGIATLMMNWRSPSDKISGKMLFIRETLRVDADWKPVELTFKTPAMFCEFPLQISVPSNGQNLLLDDFKLEKLSADAEVKYLPDYEWK